MAAPLSPICWLLILVPKSGRVPACRIPQSQMLLRAFLHAPAVIDESFKLSDSVFVSVDAVVKCPCGQEWLTWHHVIYISDEILPCRRHVCLTHPRMAHALTSCL